MESKQVLVNIPQSVIDPFYRYKRHLIEVKTVQHNGGQTKILNLPQLALELNRETQQLGYWFQKKLKTRTIFSREGFTLQGMYTSSELDQFIEEYIAKHVLCDHCKNPESISLFSKKKSLPDNMKNVYYRKCKACGKKSGQKS